MFRAVCIVVLASCLVASGNNDLETNEISSRSISSADRLVSSVILDCLDGQHSAMRCVRVKTLEYLETIMPSKRALKTPAADVKDDTELDSRIGERVQRYIDTHQFKVQLPEFFFQGATLVFTPAKSLLDFDVEFPQTSGGDQRSIDEERDMKKNMLLPLLMLIKLKLKTIIPILLTIVHVKATKALIMSKLAILLVGGFLAFQILQKKQMMQMMMSVEPTPAPSSAYGPPAPTYGPPTNSYGPPSSTVSSYEAPIYDVPSSWEPSPPQGPYARVGWDAQSMAYNGYTQSTNQQSSTS